MQIKGEQFVINQNAIGKMYLSVVSLSWLTVILNSLSPSIHTVSISGLEPDSPQPQPWQSKIVAGNKVHCLYSQWLFYSARAGAGGCLVQDQISILYCKIVIFAHLDLDNDMKIHNREEEKKFPLTICSPWRQILWRSSCLPCNGSSRRDRSSQTSKQLL